MAPQFLLPLDSPAEPETFHLRGPEAHHIVHVLRYAVGQPLCLFDGKGGRFEGVIEAIHEDGSVSGRIIERLAAPSARPALSLYQGLLKASHWELVLEKGTELGVSRFVPVLTPRTVVVLREAERVKAKQERWGKILLAASKQCQRADLPSLESPVEFRDAIRAAQGRGATLLAWEGLAGQPGGPALRRALASAGEGVNLFVGPEGGFTEDEVELAKSLGALVFGLGPRILRAETAAFAACALVQYELGAL